MSEIQQFYSGQTIFITGGTGFLGKILIEKLLRSCPKIKTIYILIREKKGKQIQDRIKEITSSLMFEPLREIDPNFEKKILPMPGDVIKPNFGLSTADLQLLKKEVSIVFHAAATTRFDEPLKIALQVNVDSVKTMLDICKECKKLKAFVYVSTAFSNSIYEHVEEKVYPGPLSHEKLTDLVGVMDKLNMTKKENIKFTKLVIGKFPNTYCFTKSMAEDLVSKSAKELPISIYRFSIAMAALREPLMGWLDSSQALTQSIVRIGLGIIRVICVKRNENMETVPIDLACNCLIASAWEAASKKNNKQELQVYNYVSGTDNPVSWGYLQTYLRRERYKLAIMKTIYYPDTMIIESLHLFFFLHYILHFIPAILGDASLRILGKKPMFYKIFKKGTKLVMVIRFFTNGKWHFDTENVKSLWKKLSETDKKLFNFDITSFTWDELLTAHCYGSRRYLLKTDMSSEEHERAVRKAKNLFYIHQVVRGTFYIIVFWLIWKIFCILF
ncbi:fatty acyl-CoA reductase wat-like [Leptopilina heterotoma]|uniref:fatty acyl-CoA reductase wat-like n=1 Tax=Leptopilina heterotoma TaxID=63436 RepID=UPI001CA7D8F6|nr:fatty acyl-CoA reductase wat-like [Leptopilina heterotoma]